MEYNENKCQGLAGTLLGHKFEAVFENETKNEPDTALIQVLAPTLQACYEKVVDYGYDAPGALFDSVIEELGTRRSTYVHHVCARCGKIVKRS